MISGCLSLKSTCSAHLRWKKKVCHTKTAAQNLKIASCFLNKRLNEPLPSGVGIKREGELGISSGGCNEQPRGLRFGFQLFHVCTSGFHTYLIRVCKRGAEEHA